MKPTIHGCCMCEQQTYKPQQVMTESGLSSVKIHRRNKLTYVV
jgi:hypothetical protein